MEKIKILIADDDPLLINLYADAFRRSGYEVETAFDGADALNKLQAMDIKPTAILSDIMMPKMNGLELLEKIKSNPSLKNIPAVMLTNLGSDEDAKRGLTLGAVTYLVKSEYTPKEVVAKLQEIIAGYSHKGVPEVKVAVKGGTKSENSGKA